jgi:hypothetical protein
MQHFYKHFPEIDNVYWTNYFLKEFIPKYKFLEKTSVGIGVGSSHIEWYIKDLKSETEILRLSSLLSSKLRFPPIEYFLIFRHMTIDQPIHADGREILRNSSFNLPLLGYEGTSMCFYEQKTILSPIIKNANYYEKDNLTLVETFSGGNEWVLVNSAVPHNVVNLNANNPRLTVCVRFLGNPKFDDLITNKV